MIIPREKDIYRYKDVDYVLLSNNVFRKVYCINVCNMNDHCSHFYEFNWWNFVFNAKKIGTTKPNKAY